MDARVENFIVGHNYQLQEVIGEGAYGIVWYVPPVLSHISLKIQLRPRQPQTARRRTYPPNAK